MADPPRTTTLNSDLDNQMINVNSLLQMLNGNGSDFAELQNYFGDPTIRSGSGEPLVTNGSPLNSIEVDSLYNMTGYPVSKNQICLTSSVDDGNVSNVTVLQSGFGQPESMEIVAAVSNPIVRVVPCRLVERSNRETWLIVPTQGAPQPYVSVPVPGGFPQLTPPTIAPESGPSRSNDTHDPEPYVMMSNLSTVEEMQALENSLKDPKNRKRLEDEFQGRAGTNAKNHMTRALSNLMKVELAGQYSWAGMARNKEKKHNFKDLQVAKILVDAILKVYYDKKNIKKKNSARLKLENVIKEWLKRQGVASKKAGN